MPIRLRIALFGAVLVTLMVVGISVLLYRVASSSFAPNQDQQLVQRVLAFLEAAPAETFTAQRPFAPIDPAESNDTFVELLDAQGAPLVSTATLAGAPPSIPAAVLETASQQGSALATVAAEPNASLRVYVRPWSRPDLARAGFLIVGQSTRVTQSLMQATRAFIQLLALLTLAGALLGIWIVAGRALQPLRLVASTADEIRLSGDLSRRLPQERRQDELGHLARSFNGMLGRLQEAQDRLASALEAQRRFVADASHELRTPLTTIRSNAGFLLHRPEAAAADRHAALADIASESDRMARLVQDLLVLARADAGVHLDRRPLRLDQLVAEVGRQAQHLYVEHAVGVSAETAVLVCGDADALKQLLWILLDNAHRFAAHRIDLTLSGDATDAWLLVADDGPGIPDADRERIFERFFQADLSRAGTGAGLGLPIARWIATEHGGQLQASNRQPGPGACFRVRLPRLPTAAHS